jgi:hypothetical protein
MFHFRNAISGGELNQIQQVFDRVISRKWFVRDAAYEQELAAYMIHMHLSGITEPRVLYEMGARAAICRAKARKAS